MENNRIIIEGKLELDYTDDGGRAKGFYGLSFENTLGEDGTYVQISSYDDSKEHIQFNQLENKKVRITIEVLE